MKELTYREKLQNPKWQQKRLRIFERDNWTCQECGDKETTLHVHHERYVGNPWSAPDSALKTLCARCHRKEHFPPIPDPDANLSKIEVMQKTIAGLQEKISSGRFSEKAVHNLKLCVLVANRELERLINEDSLTTTHKSA